MIDIDTIRARHVELGQDAQAFAVASWAQAIHNDRGELLAEVDRLRAFITAALSHGMTTWPDGGRGTGRAAGQMVTTEAHIEVLDHLLRCAWHGDSVTDAADQWAELFPTTVRLDQPPAAPRRRGLDGRPIGGGPRG